MKNSENNTTLFLQEKIADASKTLVMFVKALSFGIVAAILLVVPCLLRTVAFLVWLVGAFAAIMAIQTIYTPFSNSGEVLALQFTVVLAMVDLATVLMLKKKDQLWSGLAFGGLMVWSVSYGACMLSKKWQYADFVFQVLPPALFAVGLIVMTLRLRVLRSKGNMQFATQAFVWLQKLKGGDTRSPE